MGSGVQLAAALGRDDTAELEARLLYLAWRSFRISRDIAEDLVQAAIVTFLEVRERYAEDGEHIPIFVGIFKNKCRAHIGTTVRDARGIRALRAAAEAGLNDISGTATAEPGTEAGVLAELMNREDGRLILDALAQLRPQAREMFELMGRGATRQDLIRYYGLNKNTLDSRLHAYRNELRLVLARRGLDV